MVSRIDIIGQNGNDGDHYMLEKLKEFVRFDALVTRAIEDYCTEEGLCLESFEFEDGGFSICYSYTSGHSYEVGYTHLSLEEVVKYIEDPDTNT